MREEYARRTGRDPQRSLGGDAGRFIAGAGRARICPMLLMLVLLASCGGGVNPSEELQARPADSLHISSPAFRAGSEIPAKYTCKAENISPPLEWTAPPAGTKSLALITDDPDAPGRTWVHWVAYNLPVDLHGLREDTAKQPEISGGGLQGKNDFGEIGYDGPCPPPGKAHHYHFKLYALDAALQLQAGAEKDEVVQAMSGHVLAEGELIGLFKR